MEMGRNGKTESHSRTPLAGRLAIVSLSDDEIQL